VAPLRRRPRGDEIWVFGNHKYRRAVRRRLNLHLLPKTGRKRGWNIALNAVPKRVKTGRSRISCAVRVCALPA
jgi:hypothetical protein